MRKIRVPTPSLTALLAMITLATVMAAAGICQETRKKRILYVDSYHIEYAWSADITRGIKSVLDGRNDVELRIVRMDTKRNKSEEFKRAAALRVKRIIEEWRPDVVIASDDNASKYLIVPYFLGSDIPFVFCGLNWDASVYGFPADNVTGMVEVAMFEPLLATLRKFAKGDRIGYLASDVVTERKELENIKKRFGTVMKVRFAKTFEELRHAFLELQLNTDMVILSECRSVQGFDHRRMEALALEHTRVPTGATQRFMARYALITYSRVGQEQGEYAARTALAILAGVSPKKIHLVTNKRAQIYLNMKIAKRLGVKFPLELIENAHIISAEPQKILFVNSYHRGYRWADDVEKGLLRVLGIDRTPSGRYDTHDSDLLFRVFHMDAKRNPDPAHLRRKALETKKIVDQWKPDIVLVSDDAAVKYLVVPYLVDTPVPVVFCGVNWTTREYGLTDSNVTGMIEISPVKETIEAMRPFAKGDRLGFMAAENPTNRKTMTELVQRLGLRFTDGAFVQDFQQWKREYRRLQDRVDMLLWLTTSTVQGWDDTEAHRVILEETRIPSGCLADHQARYTLLGKVKIGTEQGWWLGKTALRILDGTSPSEIPMTTNKESILYLNMELARRLGIKFPMDMIEEAVFVGEPMAP